jgi:sugar O-acyltransferase (sialic acid O-acetyltransferase NeuD family)
MGARRLILIGAGDHGRGVLEIVRRLQAAGEELEVEGFVDDASKAAEVDGVPVLGPLSYLEEKGGELGAELILALADPAAKRKIAARFDGLGARWATVVHPSAEIAPSVTLGPGTVINAGVVVVYETVVGAHVTVNLNATVGHHVRLGDYGTVAPGANILGKVVIGEGCQVHANAVILPGLRIGAGAVVGAGSVVLRDLPAGQTVFGNPARPVPLSR